MSYENFIFEEAEIASLLRNEILKDVENLVLPSKSTDFGSFEFVSTVKEPCMSPIMTMSRDEILGYVEGHEISELANLTSMELDKISEVLGINPAMFAEDIE